MSNTLDILSTAEKMTIAVHGHTAALDSISGEIAELEVEMAALLAKKARAEDDLGTKTAEFEEFLKNLPEGLEAEKIKTLSEDRVRQLADAGLLDSIQSSPQEPSPKPSAKKKATPKKAAAKKSDAPAEVETKAPEAEKEPEAPTPTESVVKDTPEAEKGLGNADEVAKDHDFLEDIGEGDTAEEKTDVASEGKDAEEPEDKADAPDDKGAEVPEDKKADTPDDTATEDGGKTKAVKSAATKKFTARPKLKTSKAPATKSTAADNGSDADADAIEKLATEDDNAENVAASNDEDLISDLATSVGEDETPKSDSAGEVEIPDWM